MRDETKVVVSTLIGREKYDEACKKAWMMKEIIAPVLQYTIKEYQAYSVPEIIGYINADSIADDVPVDDLPAVIESADTELASPTEKRVFFNIHFTAKNPNLSSKDVLVMLHIDFEVQNDYKPSNPSYPIVKRAIYYVARELSTQLGVVTGVTNYDKLEKVYSIWICNERIPEVKSQRKTALGLKTRLHGNIWKKKILWDSAMRVICCMIYWKWLLYAEERKRWRILYLSIWKGCSQRILIPSTSMLMWKIIRK